MQTDVARAKYIQIWATKDLIAAQKPVAIVFHQSCKKIPHKYVGIFLTLRAKWRVFCFFARFVFTNQKSRNESDFRF